MELKLITRDQARERGYKRYFTGNPCVNGHVCERQVSTANCLQCSRDSGKKYRIKEAEKIKIAHKKYYDQNKEKYKLYDKNHKINNREKLNKRQQKKYWENREKILEKQNLRRRENRVEINKKRREEYAKKPEVFREYARRSIKRNKHVNAANNAARRASKQKATPKWANKKLILEFYKLARLLSSQTGIKYHVDHVIPLIHNLVCGLHVENNLRVITAVENIKKKNQFSVS